MDRGAGLKRRSRRAFLASLAALGAGACAGGRWLPWSRGTSAASGGAPPDDLLALAARFVEIAERGRGERALWGRLGGSGEEAAAAELLAAALGPHVEALAREDFELTATRPRRWSLALDGGAALASAMPAPIDARFPGAPVRAPIVVVSGDADWARVSGAWAYLAATMKGTPALNSVRDGKLYERALEAGARGFVFSLPTPPGTWRLVPPVDKAYALADSRFPDGRRPIPAFCVDAEDGARLAAAAGRGLVGAVDAEERDRFIAANVVARIAGELPARVGVMSHLDSFFAGANDNASGLATLVGLARRLHDLRARGTRTASFELVGLAAHHDGGAGMRAFQARDPARFAALGGIVLIEHTDGLAGNERESAGWPADFNDKRQAFLGSQPWPVIEAALPDLVRESALMPVAPLTAHACISDLLVVCDRLPTFSLIQAPPYYHSDHDTLDKISRAGIEHAVEFHVRLLERAGFLAS